MDEQPKKIFDITPPKPPAPSGPTGAPTVTEPAVQTHKLMTSEPKKDDPATLVEPNPVTEDVPVTRKGTNIAPPSADTVAEPSDPEVTEDQAPAEAESVPDTVAEEAKSTDLPDAEVVEVAEPEPEKPAEPTQEETEPEKSAPEDKQTIVTEPFGAVDGLPDSSEKASADATEAMQSPKIFDTKAYYVPIGNTNHKHGHLVGSLVAGVITATVVLVGLFVLLQFK